MLIIRRLNCIDAASGIILSVSGTLALFYNTFIIILYMFRASHAHHQEVELYRCSIWYRPLSQWPSATQVERELVLSQPVHRTATYRVTIPNAVLIQIDLLMMSTTLLEACRGL